MQIQELNKKRVRKASMLSIATAIFLLLLKIMAWLASDSVSVLSSLTDSLMDIITSSMNFIAIRYAMIPADDNHQYGHAKAEALAALAQALIIGGSALSVFWLALERLQTPEPITEIGFSMSVMLCSTLISILLVSYQRWVYIQTQSLAIKADSAHYQADIFINLAVIFALYGASRHWQWLDPAVSLIIVFILLSSSLSIFKEVFKILMDEAVSDEDKKAILHIIKDCDEIQGLKRIQTRRAGTKIFIHMVLKLDAKMRLKQVKPITDLLKKQVKQALPQSEMSIEVEPLDVD